MDGIIRIETGPEPIGLFDINASLGRGFIYQAEVRFLALVRTRLTFVLAADERTAPLLPLFALHIPGLGCNCINGVNMCLT